MSQTHPDRLASVATLFGMTPAPVTSCRVLEVGCGDGANLIPMAYSLPGSQFTGIDLAESAIAEGRRGVDELGLSNLSLGVMDLREAGSALGEFDYIVAHGVYSWVPDDVREGLLGLCRDCLAPQGVAFISYNALPGRHVRIMLREMMLHHTRDYADPTQRIQQARAFLEMLGESRVSTASWHPMIDDEVKRLLAGDPAWLFHDDLGPINDSFYFRDFAARAARHSLQYLGDAQPHLMFDIRDALHWLEGDVIEREQYLDFLLFRRFRQTLLCREEVTLDRPATAERMDRFLFSSPARLVDGQFEGLHKVSISAVHELTTQVATALGELYPLPVGFDEFLEYTQDRTALCEILFALISSGFADLHVFDFPCEQSVTRRPRASRLARWECSRSELVTSSGHRVSRLDPMYRALIALLDGTREFDAIVDGLARAEGAPTPDELREHLPGHLAQIAGLGLLEG